MNAPEFTATKSTVELYKFRAKGGYWADITIDANGSTGRISIASDYGSWQNYWGACGSDFKTFLAEINEDYAADKFGVQERVDAKATIESWREEVLKYRRRENITADEARDIWDEIEGLAAYNHDELERELMSSIYLIEFLREWADCEWLLHCPDPRFARFWKELWPAMLAEFALEKETAIPA